MYLIGLATVGVSVFMVWTAHPVYMVVSLVLVSLGLGMLAIGSGSQFIGLVVVLVYVGAVNVLFLFVIMMINLRVQLLPFVVEQSIYSIIILWGVGSLKTSINSTSLHWIALDRSLPVSARSSLAELGGYMFGTTHVLANVIVSGVLFVAMISAICLTMVVTENYRSQSFFAQTTRPAAVFAFSQPQSDQSTKLRP